MSGKRGPDGQSVRSCADRVPLGARLWRAFVTRPRSLVLAIIGVGVFTIGILVRQDGVGIGLVVLGVAALSLGVLLPTVQEAQIGPGGFTLKTSVDMREAELRPFAESQHERMQRLAYLLVADRRVAAASVEDSIARAYGDWGLIGTLDRAFYLLCTVVRSALGSVSLGLVDPTATTEGGLEPGLASRMATLMSIPLHLRAVAVLHYHEQLDDGQIASILDLDPQEVRQRLRRAEAELAAARPTTPGGV
jgi:hypothetical protein